MMEVGYLAAGQEGEILVGVARLLLLSEFQTALGV
jgi:hypothetical protein